MLVWKAAMTGFMAKRAQSYVTQIVNHPVVSKMAGCVWKDARQGGKYQTAAVPFNINPKL